MKSRLAGDERSQSAEVVFGLEDSYYVPHIINRQVVEAGAAVRMIDLVIDAVKMVLSEDARKTASGLIDFIRKSPSWHKDICVLEAKIDGSSREHAYLLGALTADKMQSLEYSPDSIGAFEYVYRELTSNSFEHGCKAKGRSQKWT